MLICEAELQLQSYGVTKIEKVPSTSCPQVWKVTQNDENYIYAAKLETVVRAITEANNW